jgi:hypothetical protein
LRGGSIVPAKGQCDRGVQDYRIKNANLN